MYGSNFYESDFGNQTFRLWPPRSARKFIILTHKNGLADFCLHVCAYSLDMACHWNWKHQPLTESRQSRLIVQETLICKLIFHLLPVYANFYWSQKFFVYFQAVLPYLKFCKGQKIGFFPVDNLCFVYKSVFFLVTQKFSVYTIIENCLGQKELEHRWIELFTDRNFVTNYLQVVIYLVLVVD